MDEGGMRYRVEVAGKTLLRDSQLGLVFQDGTKLGPAATILNVSRAEHDGGWENAFGKHRFVRDHWREMRLSLAEKRTEPSRRFGLIVRAYDDGVAFRYDLPVESGLGECGLLGPMGFTPGGFLDRTPEEFKTTSPAQVMGTRARQLAMTVIYESPLLVLCDSPANYRGQPGIEFLRGLPTVWDDTRVLNADVGETIAIARRSGDRWYLAAINGAAVAALKLPLSFLGEKNWQMRIFADSPEKHDCQAITEKTETVTSNDVLSVPMQPAGGFTAILILVPSSNK